MPRTRTIRPDFWNDEKLASVSRDSRLTFVGLWTISDDYGIVRGHPLWLKNQIFPYDNIVEKQMIKYLVELENIQCIFKFNHHTEKYYFINNFLKHQKIDHPSKTRNPYPSRDILETFATGSRDNRYEYKLKERESKEKEKEKAFRDSSFFEILWKAYPVGTEKQKAISELKKLKPENGLKEKMLKAIETQIIHKKEMDRCKKFTPPFPALCRWIKNKRWEDEVKTKKKNELTPEQEEARQRQIAKLETETLSRGFDKVLEG